MTNITFKTLTLKYFSLPLPLPLPSLMCVTDYSLHFSHLLRYVKEPNAPTFPSSSFSQPCQHPHHHHLSSSAIFFTASLRFSPVPIPIFSLLPAANLPPSSFLPPPHLPLSPRGSPVIAVTSHSASSPHCLITIKLTTSLCRPHHQLANNHCRPPVSSVSSSQTATVLSLPTTTAFLFSDHCAITSSPRPPAALPTNLTWFGFNINYKLKSVCKRTRID